MGRAIISTCDFNSKEVMKFLNKFKFQVLLMVGLMMVTLCSCADHSTQMTSEESSSIVSNEKVEFSEPDATEETEMQASGAFSDNTLGSIFQLINDVIGKDLDTAEKMIGDFFDVEFKEKPGHVMTDERMGVVTTLHFYDQILSKDSVRFNGIEIWTDEENGLIRRVSLTCTNTSYTAASIEDTPEFRDEIKKLNIDMNNEFKLAKGEPFKTGDLAWDEDSFYNCFIVSDDCLACIEIRDFTEPEGNGLLSTTAIFADCEILVYY